MACTYTLVDANGKQITLNGPAEFKAYLVESGLKQFYPDGKYPWSPKEAAIEPSAQIDFKASQAFADRLMNGESFKTIVQARKALTTQVIESGTELAKKADEAIELAGVLAARRIVNQGMSESDTFDALVKIADQMPSLNVRTSESIAQQAYSTPLPLAYVASVRSGITKQTTVIEPTAGNGALVMAANPKLTTVNELNKSRAESLKEQGFDVTTNDAVKHDFGNRDANVVIANPPFGVVKDDDNKTIAFNISGGYSTNEIDHAIALNALKAMGENGKAVLIVGGPSKMLSDEKRSDAYNGKAKRQFYFTLYNQYNVTDHFTVSGDLYAKQGAAWPVDVIVINGVGKSDLKLPAANLPRIINSIEELKNELQANRASLPKNIVSVEQATRSQTETGDAGSSLANKPSADTESNQNRQSSSVLSGLGNNTERNGSNGNNLRQQDNNIAGRPARADTPTDTIENKFQAPYRPGSAVNPVGTLVPVNMQASIETALQRVIDKHGDLDVYVADLLDYKVEDIGKYFSAEQVDAIALALDNIEQGKGFIIGDQTGVGKGRVNAAMIRYAIKNKIIPIFVTEKANLYGDMIRDLTNIGMKDIKPFATNASESIPLDEEASEWYEKSLKAKELGEKPPAKYGKFINTPSSAKQNKAMKDMAEKGKLIDADVIFTTYSQMQTVKGAETDRMSFLNAMGDGALLILDESHNAGGTAAKGRSAEESGATGRAAMARKLVSIAKGVFYSSATYAKRPDVLDLYSKTDMGLVANLDVLKESLVAGGVALQQSIASMLAKAGQYIRREKSFDGIVYDTVNVNVDKSMAEKSSEVMREIMKFDTLKQRAVKEIKESLKSEAGTITSDKATGAVGAESSNFSSVMHNMIGQMLLILKTKPAVDEAIAALKRGEKPVITLSNTMGSVIGEYAEDMGLNVGDAIDLNVGYLLKRYAKKSRRVTITDAYGKKTTKELSDAELGPAAVRQYNKIINLIDGFDFSNYPISPIDYIHNELEKAGYKSNEITGRNNGIDYSKETPTYKIRSGQDKTPAGKRKIINDFNNGLIDVIILNQSGSTGISLHSSPNAGRDTRKRHMIVAQPELNIDTHMQMLGRVNRTGQLNLPSYAQLAADIPAEKRPSAILAKKMAMLNANTTAGKESAVKAKDVPDFMNQYGDEIVASIMKDNPDIHKVLGEPLGKDFDKEGAIAKVSGRIPVLSLKEQETLYQAIEDEYNDYIDMLTKTGENQLEAHAMDLGAKTVSEEVVVPAIEGSDSPFAEPVIAKTVDAKKLGKPYTIEQIKSLVEKQQYVDAESRQKFTDKSKAEYQSALAEIDKMDDSDQLAIDRKNSALNTLNYLRNNLNNIFQKFYPGKSVLITSPKGMQYMGIVGKFERKQTGKNYFAQGQWKVTVYVADASKQFVIPLSKLTETSESDTWQIERENLDNVKKAFEEGLSSTREQRVILTGNMLAAYGFNKTGQIVNYTDNKGEIHQGVLMPKKFDLKAAIEAKPVVFDTPDIAIDFVNDQDIPSRLRGLRTGDNSVKLNISDYEAVLSVPASKAKGGMYFNNKRLTDLLGIFYKRGNEMLVRIRPNEVNEVIRALYPIANSMQPISKEEGKKFFDKQGIKYSKVEQAAGSTVAQIEKLLPNRVKKMVQAGKLKVVQSVNDLPASLQDAGNALYHTVWHGSPYDFERFSSEKINTGEGAQAFGYGLYFTDKQSVAEWYRDTLSKDTLSIKSGFFKKNKIFNEDNFKSSTGKTLFINQLNSAKKVDISALINDIKMSLDLINPKNDYRAHTDESLKKKLQNIKDITSDINMLEKIKNNGGFSQTTNKKLYEVDLAPSQDEYLDWDKPLSEQSEKVRKALRNAEGDFLTGSLQPLENTNGFGLYRAASRDYGSDKAASDYLHSLGIRGIRYKAEGGKADASNYVIFSDKDISITAKYSKLAGVEGLYDPKSDTVYLVADMLNKDNLQVVLSHELLHRAEMTDKRYIAAIQKFESQLKERFELAKQGIGSAIEIKAAKRVIAADTKLAHQEEEFRAYIVSEYAKSPDSFVGELKKIIADFIAAIRMALLRSGFDMGFINTLTPADLYALSKYGANANLSPISQTVSNLKSTKAIPDTIKIDGIDRPTTNSNGQLIHQTEEGIRNFWKWFGDSKVVDDKGKPLVVYHGSKNATFDTFDPSKSGTGDTFESSVLGMYFATNKSYASGMAGPWFNKDGSSNLPGMYPVYLKANKVLYSDIATDFLTTDESLKLKKQAVSNKYDGITDDYGHFVVFNSTQIKSAIGNAGAFDSNNPDIRYSKQFADLQNKAIDAIQSRIKSSKTFNKWHLTVGTQYHKALIDKDFGRVFNASLSFENDTARFANESADQAPSLLPKTEGLQDVAKEVSGKGFKRIKDAKKVANAIFETTLNDSPMTDAELKAEGYSDEQRKMYKEFFAAVNHSLDELAKSELFRLARAMKLNLAPQNFSLRQTANFYTNQLSSQEDKDLFDKKVKQIGKLQSKGYAPLMRFGRFTVDAVNQNTSKREFFGMFETEKEANEMAKVIAEEYPDATVSHGILSQKSWEMFKGVTPETMEAFAKMMNVEQDEAFQLYLAQAVNNRSAMKRLIHRKKIPGFAKDPQRILASFITSNAKATSKNYNMGELVDAISHIPKGKGDVIDEAIDLYNFVQNPSEAGSQVRGLLFAWYMGGSFASAMVNTTQTLTTTLPYLHQFGSTQQVAGILGEAMKLAAKNPKALGGDLGRALHRAEEEGVTAPHELHMLYGESMRTSLASNAMIRPLQKAWGSFHALTEGYNRRVAFIAAYNLAKENKNPNPFKFAEDAVNQTQFIYSKSSRPNWARGAVGSTLFTFKTFTINYLEFLKRLPMQERLIALGVLILMSGLSGLPGSDDADDVLDTIGQYLGYNTNTKEWKEKIVNDMLGKEAGQFALHGVSSFLPIDIGSRLSVGNVIPGTAILKKSETDKKRDVMEFFGAAGSLVEKGIQAFEASQSREGVVGKVQAIAHAALPKALSDAYQALDMVQTGYYRDYKGKNVQKVNEADALFKMLGLQPTKVSEPKQRERMMQQDIAMVRAVETDIADLWANGLYEKNPSKVTEAKEMLSDWNRKNPETPIKVKMSQILRRAKSMKQLSSERLAKSAPKELRKFARESLAE